MRKTTTAVDVNGQEAIPDFEPGTLTDPAMLAAGSYDIEITLGVLQGYSREFLLPAGLDVGEYAVVDISREHPDGGPGHGGDSLVRGEIG